MNVRRHAVRRAGETAALWGLLAVSLLGAAILPLRLANLARPPEAMNAIVVGIESSQSRSGHAFRFPLADGDVIHWTCDASACRPSALALERIKWDTPMPAEFQFSGDRLVGLTVREAEILEPDVEVGQASAGALAASVGCGLMALGSGATLYHRRTTTYRRPKPQRLSLRRLRKP